MNGKRRKLALALCAILLFSLFFSVFYLAAEANHVCTGAQCPICHEMQLCAETLKKIGTALVLVLLQFIAVFFGSFRKVRLPARLALLTPVFLKVKLNN